MDRLLHPMLVHFPIALLFTSVLFDIVATWFKRETFREGALWLLIIGLTGGIAASFAGGWAEKAAEQAGIAESLIETHETLAFATLGIFSVLLLGRLLLRNQLTTKTAIPYFLVAAIGLGTLSATGHFGGDLVYEHGAGVATLHHPDSPLVVNRHNPHS
ncbi:MAG: DUF2231 domain-containing protein [Nitrospirota bacterium]|nr:DUF2231 domain-containing protein [Nitrospirota bacterium]